MNDDLLDIGLDEVDAGSHSDIQLDFSDPDFTEDGRDYWEHYRYEVEKGQVLLRIDKYLVERIKGTSRNRIQNAAEAQCIRVNGRPVKSNYRVHPGEIISVVMDRPRYENEIVARTSRSTSSMRTMSCWWSTSPRACACTPVTATTTAPWSTR